MPTYDLPTGFTLDHLHRPAGSEIKATGPDAYSFVSGALSGTFTLTPTQITFPEETDPTVLTFVQAQLAKVGQPPQWDGLARSLFNKVEPLAGTSPDDWEMVDLRNVVELILWDKKALNNDRNLKHPREWVKRKPAE